MTKIVYNACYGGFSLSDEAETRLKELGYRGTNRQIERSDPLLIQVIEELGVAANGPCANLRIRELPSGTKYRIDEYDGYEAVCTPEDYEWITVP